MVSNKRRNSNGLKEYDARISEFREKLLQLLSVDARTIRNVLDKKPLQFNVEGVYIISTPDDRKIVYAGKTSTKSIIARLRDHRNIDTTSDLKGMLKVFADYPQEIDDYLVRCVEIMHSRERTFFEYFVISILQPPFNK